MKNFPTRYPKPIKSINAATEILRIALHELENIDEEKNKLLVEVKIHQATGNLENSDHQTLKNEAEGLEEICKTTRGELATPLEHFE
jgi:hypothetical protein